MCTDANEQGCRNTNLAFHHTEKRKGCKQQEYTIQVIVDGHAKKSDKILSLRKERVILSVMGD